MRAQPRGTTNRNLRGNTRQRRLRRQWLLDTFGNGTEVECQLRETLRCMRRATVLDINSVSIDCYPIPRCDGGTYARGNIRPACLPCNSRHGGRLGAARRRKPSSLTRKIKAAS